MRHTFEHLKDWTFRFTGRGAASAVIRPYRREDRAAVRRLYCDTAFRGCPIDPYLPDRELFADAMTAYYTDQEPERCLVLTVDDRLAGILLATLDAAHWRKALLRRYGHPLLAAGLRRCAAWARPSRRLLSTLIRENLVGRMSEVIAAPEYPGRLHVALGSAWRARGLGRPLLDQSLALLRSGGARGVHSWVFREDEASVRFFERAGFRRLGEVEAPYWPAGVQSVRMLAMGRSLRPSDRLSLAARQALLRLDEDVQAPEGTDLGVGD